MLRINSRLKRKPMLKTVRLIAIIVIAINFSACGFALRGANKGDTVPGTTMYVQAAQANAELAQELNAALQQAQMHIVNTPQQAQYVLSVGAENFVSRTSTVNGRARAAQYDLQLSVEVSLARRALILTTRRY